MTQAHEAFGAAQRILAPSHAADSVLAERADPVNGIGHNGLHRSCDAADQAGCAL
jgi:hypothetical protein